MKLNNSRLGSKALSVLNVGHEDKDGIFLAYVIPIEGYMSWMQYMFLPDVTCVATIVE